VSFVFSFALLDRVVDRHPNLVVGVVCSFCVSNGHTPLAWRSVPVQWQSSNLVFQEYQDKSDKGRNNQKRANPTFPTYGSNAKTKLPWAEPWFAHAVTLLITN
jgi:hypothetical protein